MSTRSTGCRVGRSSLHVLAFAIALMAVLTSARPEGQLPVHRAAEAPGVGAARIGPPTLESGSQHRAIESQHTVEAIGDPPSRASFVAGPIAALSSHSPPACLLHYVAVQPRSGSPLTGRSTLVNAPKTSPPDTRS